MARKTFLLSTGSQCLGMTFKVLLLSVVCIIQARSQENATLPGEIENLPCYRDCSNAPYRQVCASNEQQYNSECEFEVAKCQEALDGESLIDVHRDSPCTTLPPPSPDHQKRCSDHQNTFDEISTEEYDKICVLDVLTEKESNGSLKVEDLLMCYKPMCDRHHNYKSYQCSYNLRGWCWCSDSQGNPINGTFRVKLRPEECLPMNTCTHNGKIYEDGVTFQDGCGFCECSDRQIRCYKDYATPLNDSLLEMLKEDLIQFFYFQLNEPIQSTKEDIRHVRMHPTIISESSKRKVLEWKFDLYDKNHNDMLNDQELIYFRLDIRALLKCVSFFSYLVDLMDKNNDNNIVISEWGSLFDIELQPQTSGSSASGQEIGVPVKRSASLTSDNMRFLRFQKRKKFYYTLQ